MPGPRGGKRLSPERRTLRQFASQSRILLLPVEGPRDGGLTRVDQPSPGALELGLELPFRNRQQKTGSSPVCPSVSGRREHRAAMPPGKLNLAGSIFAQPPPEPDLPKKRGARLSIAEELEALKTATAHAEASYAKKKEEIDAEIGSAPPPSTGASAAAPASMVMPPAIPPPIPPASTGAATPAAGNPFGGSAVMPPPVPPPPVPPPPVPPPPVPPPPVPAAPGASDELTAHATEALVTDLVRQMSNEAAAENSSPSDKGAAANPFGGAAANPFGGAAANPFGGAAEGAAPAAAAANPFGEAKTPPPPANPYGDVGGDEPDVVEGGRHSDTARDQVTQSAVAALAPSAPPRGGTAPVTSTKSDGGGEQDERSAKPRRKLSLITLEEQVRSPHISPDVPSPHISPGAPSPHVSPGAPSPHISPGAPSPHISLIDWPSLTFDHLRSPSRNRTKTM